MNRQLDLLNQAEDELAQVRLKRNMLLAWFRNQHIPLIDGMREPYAVPASIERGIIEAEKQVKAYDAAVTDNDLISIIKGEEE